MPKSLIMHLFVTLMHPLSPLKRLFRVSLDTSAYQFHCGGGGRGMEQEEQVDRTALNSF